MNTISCGLTFAEREVLLTRGKLSMAARIALYSAAVLAENEQLHTFEFEPLVLLDVPVEVAREIRDACLLLGLRLLACKLTIQIMRTTISDGRRSGQILGGMLRKASMSSEERAALSQRGVIARRSKLGAGQRAGGRKAVSSRHR